MRIQVENAKYRRQCPVCNVNYTYNPAGKDKGHEHKRGLFCSQECRHVDVVARREAKASEAKKPKTHCCPTCSTVFEAHGKRTYCSIACRPKIVYKYEPQTQLQNCECKTCGEPFQVQTKHGRSPQFCSEECREVLAAETRRVVRARRKAMERAATIEQVDPYKVFEHDHWTCMICVNPTPKEKRGTYDLDAPELDHIVPLSKGGAHSYANTQTLCRSCNMKKSDTLVPSLRDLL